MTWKSRSRSLAGQSKVLLLVAILELNHSYVFQHELSYNEKYVKVIGSYGKPESSGLCDTLRYL